MWTASTGTILCRRFLQFPWPVIRVLCRSRIVGLNLERSIGMILFWNLIPVFLVLSFNPAAQFCFYQWFGNCQNRFLSYKRYRCPCPGQPVSLFIVINASFVIYVKKIFVRQEYFCMFLMTGPDLFIRSNIVSTVTVIC